MKMGFSAMGLAMLTLSGCDWVGILAKETAVTAISHRGWDTFTFKGQLPAEFGIDAIAFYGPNKPDQASCRAQTIEPGKTVTRQYGKRYTATIQSEPQAFSFEIPLSYYKGWCAMKLGRVKLEIKARYGKQEWQTTYANGNFWIEHPPAVDSSSFTDTGTLHISALCSFRFQESKLFGEISKFLSCKNAGASLPRAGLANKTVDFTININPTEHPYYDQTWIQFHSGWKPCLPKEGGWIKCQSPPLFKTFKMNGQTCTVYPGCTE